LNSEISKSLKIIKIINQHLAENPECSHSLKVIMTQALMESESEGTGVDQTPATTTTTQSTPQDERIVS
jgi:hypothetical protein